MPLKIKCPTCKRVLSVPVQRIGAIVRCPVCEKKLRVPKPRHSKTEDSATRERRSKTRQEQSRPATRSSKPTPPPAKDPPRDKREPVRPPEPQETPDRRKKSPAKKPSATESTPKPPEPPPVAAKPTPPTTDPPKKEAPAPEPPDPPKPPPLTKAKRKKRVETPPTPLLPAKSLTEDPKPKEREAKSDIDKGRIKADSQKQRWKEEQGQPLPPEVPPLPQKPVAQKDAPEDVPSDAPTKPPQMPSRPKREETPAKTVDTETKEPDREVIRGFEHDIHRRRTVYHLGIALMLTALFGAIPAVMDIVESLRAVEPRGVASWAFALLLVSAIQLAYSIYLVQLPDWSTAWVVSLVALVMATGYAMFLGIVLLAKDDNLIIRHLDLANTVYGNKAAGWCLIMLSISSLLAYFSGRISVRWHHAYDLLTRTAPEP